MKARVVAQCTWFRFVRDSRTQTDDLVSQTFNTVNSDTVPPKRHQTQQFLIILTIMFMRTNVATSPLTNRWQQQINNNATSIKFNLTFYSPYTQQTNDNAISINFNLAFYSTNNVSPDNDLQLWKTDDLVSPTFNTVNSDTVPPRRHRTQQHR